MKDLHITNLPDEMKKWLEVRSAKLDITLSQQIYEFILESEAYQLFITKKFHDKWRKENIPTKKELEEAFEGEVQK